MSSLRLLIIDSHQYFLRSACCYLKQLPGIEAVETAADFDQANLHADQQQPDLILIDHEMLAGNRWYIKELQKFKQSNPDLEVLALYLFKNDLVDYYPPGSHPISGGIAKETFAVNLLEYISSRHKQSFANRSGQGKEVD